MTLATKLTFVRVAAIPVFMVAFLWNPAERLDQLAGDWGKVLAAFVFIVAAITDYYDGAVARWYKEETTLGKFMDPIADKLLVSTALIAMVERRALTFVPAWVAIVIIAREFAVTGLRMICAPKGTVIESSRLGKWKTTFQLIAIISSLVFLAFRVMIETFHWEEIGGAFNPWHGPIISALMIPAVAVTIYSGYDYLKSHWNLLDE